MTAETQPPEDWFEWAESYLSTMKAHHAEWRNTFSSEARQVLEFAAKAAISLNHAAVGAEHLLAGVLKLKSGTASTALKQAGITLPLLRGEMESAWAGHDPRNPARPLRYTPRCKGIIQRAQAKARDLGQPVEIKDLLLELIAEDEGLPARIFQKQAVDLESLKKALEAGPVSDI